MPNYIQYYSIIALEERPKWVLKIKDKARQSHRELFPSHISLVFRSFMHRHWQRHRFLHTIAKQTLGKSHNRSPQSLGIIGIYTSRLTCMHTFHVCALRFWGACAVNFKSAYRHFRVISPKKYAQSAQMAWRKLHRAGSRVGVGEKSLG